MGASFTYRKFTVTVMITGTHPRPILTGDVACATRSSARRAGRPACHRYREGFRRSRGGGCCVLTRPAAARRWRARTRPRYSPLRIGSRLERRGDEYADRARRQRGHEHADRDPFHPARSERQRLGRRMLHNGKGFYPTRRVRDHRPHRRWRHAMAGDQRDRGLGLGRWMLPGLIRATDARCSPRC